MATEPQVPVNEQEEREVCPRKWVGKPLPDDCPELQKKARKSRGNGEDEAGSRGEAEQRPIRRKEKQRRQGSDSQSQRAEGPVAAS